MAVKAPEDYTVTEVCVWLNAIGLGSKIESFKENDVDGRLLVGLTKDDLTGDLGLSSLQAKKVLAELEFANSIASGSGGGDGGALQAENEALKAEIQKLKAEVADQKAIIDALSGPPPDPAPKRAPDPKPAPAPAPKPPPPRRHNEHEVLRGAAGGAARGVVIGAIGGAIAGDPAQGAKMGAAMGGAAGGMRGIQARRHR